MRRPLLDACVLFPSVLRDTLLVLAEQDLYTPLWSPRILDEVRRGITVKRGVPREAADNMINAMSRAFPEANVDSTRAVESAIELPDPDDRHVVAAAVDGGADVVVTFNLRDFPQPTLRRHGLQPVHPDDFLLHHLVRQPHVVRAGLTAQAARYRRPPTSIQELLMLLARCGVRNFVDVAHRRFVDNSR